MRKALITVASIALLMAGMVSAPAASAVVTCPTVDPGTGAVTAPTPAPGVDWTGCNLTYAALNGANLTGANLTGANLTGAIFVGGSVLTGANFTGADLTGATLGFSNFTGANFTGADLTGATLVFNDLTGAYVSCSNTGILGTGMRSSINTFPTGWTFASGTLSVPIVLCASAASPAPIMMWMQSVSRDTATAICPAGYAGSWAAWPNGGKGGYVCDKFVPIYGN